MAKAYDESKNRELYSIELGNGLRLSVNRYNGGEPKLQIGPRTYPKSDGSVGFGKVGRLSRDEVSDLCALLHDDLGKALGLDLE